MGTIVELPEHIMLLLLVMERVLGMSDGLDGAGPESAAVLATYHTLEARFISDLIAHIGTLG